MAAFTTIATGIGLAATAATTTGSFIQAGKQRKLQRQAEAEADRAMSEAKKELEVNFYEQLGINKEAYELEREAILTSGAQVIQAAQEAERGAAEVAGRVQMAQNEAQAQIRKAMAEESRAIDLGIASEESRLRDIGVQLNLEEVAGSQLAAAQAQEMGAQASQAALQGVTSLGQQVAAAAPLYARDRSLLNKNVIAGLGGLSERSIQAGQQAGALPITQTMGTQVAGLSGQRSPSLQTALSPTMGRPAPSSLMPSSFPFLPTTTTPNFLDWSQIFNRK